MDSDSACVTNASHGSAPKRLRPDEERDTDLYLKDGNIVLAVSHKGSVVHFRVHKSVLSKHSTIFRDMLEMPPPTEVECYDQMPLVRLSDDPKDFKRLLEILYDPCALPVARFARDTAAELLGPLRIANKYEIEGIRTRIIAIMELDWPATLKDWHLRADAISRNGVHPDPVPAVQLARECSVPSILPLAMYELSHQMLEDTCDLYRLTVDDIAMAVRGRQKLLSQLSSSACEIAVSFDYCTSADCSTLSYYIRMECFSNPRNSFGQLRVALAEIRMEEGADYDLASHVCESCRGMIAQSLQEIMDELHEACQKSFKITSTL